MNDELRKRVGNALSWTGQLYDETCYLLNDLTTEMARRGYVKRDKRLSAWKSLRSDGRTLRPGGWDPGLFGGVFQADNADAGQVPWYLGVAICFYDLDRKPINPLVVLGLVRCMDEPRAQWKDDWLVLAAFNQLRTFSYECETFAVLESPVFPNCVFNTEIRFTNSMADGSYYWPKKGWIHIRELLRISDAKGVVQLTEILDRLWKEKLG